MESEELQKTQLDCIRAGNVLNGICFYGIISSSVPQASEDDYESADIWSNQWECSMLLHFLSFYLVWVAEYLK